MATTDKPASYMKFSIPAQPELEKALNALSARVGTGQATGSNKFTAGRGLLVEQGNGIVHYSLDSREDAIIDTLPPYWPLFLANADGTYSVWLTHGVVIDRVTNNGGYGAGAPTDALVTFVADNHYTAGSLTEFPIAVGQTIYVRVMIDKSGAIAGIGADPAVSLVVGTGLKSTHYYPPIEATGSPTDKSQGSNAIKYYPIATFLAAAGGVITFTKTCAGDNIDHYRELPIFCHLGNGAVLMKWYNPDIGQYEYRSLVGVAPIKVEQKEDTIEFSLDPESGGTHFTPATGDITFWDCDGETILANIAWVNGLIVTVLPHQDVIVGDCGGSSSSSSSSTSGLSLATVRAEGGEP